MTIRRRIVRIGQSLGIRLPAHALASAHLTEGNVVEVNAEAGQIVLRRVRRPRTGWAEQFAVMAQHGDDKLLDGDQLTASSWDATEWEWPPPVSR